MVSFYRIGHCQRDWYEYTDEVDSFACSPMPSYHFRIVTTPAIDVEQVTV